MKNKLTFFIVTLFIFYLNPLVQAANTHSEACSWASGFKYPQNNGKYDKGRAIYVRVDPQRYQDIEYMELYINDVYIRKESKYPFEWAKGTGNNDPLLRQLKPGTYKLRCKIKDRCGAYHEIHRTFYVSERGSNECSYIAQFKYPQNGKYYKVGSDVYVNLDAKNYRNIKYAELYLNDQLVRRENTYPYEWAKGQGTNDSALRNLKEGKYNLICRVHDQCGSFKDYYSTFYVKSSGGGGECAYEATFKYPQPGKYYEAGSDVYVNVDAINHQSIKYVELYINGKLVRKENTYPYEWAKGQSNNDGYLRNLKQGKYILVCKVYDHCGGHQNYQTSFYVKSGGGGECAYEATFKYPQPGKYYKAGSDVYVNVDAINHQSIKYVELYVNGKLVRKENTYPYEWAKGQGNNDGYLRNLKQGKYILVCIVYDHCGGHQNYQTSFYVKGGGGRERECAYKSWFKYPKNNSIHKQGQDVYVRVDTEDYQDIQEMHLYVNGKLTRKETRYPYEWAKGKGNNDAYLRNLKKGIYRLKVKVKTDCGEWFDYYCKFYVR